MRIYFSASISGGRGQAHLYPPIITHLKGYGEVLTEFVADLIHTRMGEQDRTPEAIYQRDLDLVATCDVLVAEVTGPSLGVGVEVAEAGRLGKPVLALLQPREGRRLSAMIAGDPNVSVAEYDTLEEAQGAVDAFFQGLASGAGKI
ncbi:MAG: nucleoside 2-deoxyribosyltransferase [Candidatus Neomarinimicrobiota bacterium]